MPLPSTIWVRGQIMQATSLHILPSMSIIQTFIQSIHNRFNRGRYPQDQATNMDQGLEGAIEMRGLLSRDPKPPALPEPKDKIGFAFAIEGVLLKNGTLIPGVLDAIRFLLARDIPFAMYTNQGGGFLDPVQSYTLVNQLLWASVNISPGRQIMKHPRPLTCISMSLGFCDRDVLIIGGHGEANVQALAKKCGFNKVWTPATILSAHETGTDVTIWGILILSDSDNWDCDLAIICHYMNKNRLYICLFVCTDDFIRVTGHNTYPTISCDTFLHMVKGRPEWTKEDKAWLDDVCTQLWVDNCSADLFLSLEKMLEDANQRGNWQGRDRGPPRGVESLKRIYLVTENAKRDMPLLQRHFHQCNSNPGPEWRTLLVANVVEGLPVDMECEEPEQLTDDRIVLTRYNQVIDYTPDKQFPDVCSAISYTVAMNESRREDEVIREE